MAKIYITEAGDQWDSISKKVYGSEFFADRLMEENIEYIGTFAFDSGIRLICPDIEKSNNSIKPPWR